MISGDHALWDAHLGGGAVAQMKHFERFCSTLKLPDDGGYFRLEDWQLLLCEGLASPGIFESLSGL